MTELLKFARMAMTECLKIYVDHLTAHAAEARAAELGESISGYVRRLVMQDIRQAREQARLSAGVDGPDRTGAGRG